MSQLLTVTSLGVLRNNYDGLVGCSFTPSSSLFATGIGRFVASGNTGEHYVVLKLGSSIKMFSGLVNCSGVATGTFVYTPLINSDGNTGVLLGSGRNYWLQSMEFSGADYWFDDNATNVSGYNCSIANSTIAEATHNGATYSYVPPNLLVDLLTGTFDIYGLKSEGAGGYY